LKSSWKSRHEEAGKPASAFDYGETKLSMGLDVRDLNFNVFVFLLLAEGSECILYSVTEYMNE
jgi:hypothetical protein